MKFNPDGLQAAMQELLRFDSAKHLDEIEPQRYSHLKKVCEAVIQAYCAGMEMGDYFDEILGLDSPTTKALWIAEAALESLRYGSDKVETWHQKDCPICGFNGMRINAHIDKSLKQIRMVEGKTA